MARKTSGPVAKRRKTIEAKRRPIGRNRNHFNGEPGIGPRQALKEMTAPVLGGVLIGCGWLEQLGWLPFSEAPPRYSEHSSNVRFDSVTRGRPERPQLSGAAFGTSYFQPRSRQIAKAVCWPLRARTSVVTHAGGKRMQLESRITR